MGDKKCTSSCENYTHTATETIDTPPSFWWCCVPPLSPVAGTFRPTHGGCFSPKQFGNLNFLNLNFDAPDAANT